MPVARLVLPLRPQPASRPGWRTWAGIALLASLPGLAQAQLFSDSEARRALLDLRSRVEQLQRDQTRRLDELQGRVDRLEQTSQGQLELQNQIQTLRQELASLRGQIEVQTNELSQTQRRQRDLATDLDSRIKRFEPVAVTIDGKAFNVDVAERRAFENSLTLFRSGDFRGAQQNLQQFQTQYPQSPYGPGAQYWLGNSQYALKDSRGAIATLRGFVQRYPDHPRAPDALLSIGNAHLDLGERKQGIEAFKRVVDSYEGNAAAQTARERLNALNASLSPKKR
jgi:tol-pal system protein YbgF